MAAFLGHFLLKCVRSRGQIIALWDVSRKRTMNSRIDPVVHLRSLISQSNQDCLRHENPGFREPSTCNLRVELTECKVPVDLAENLRQMAQLTLSITNANPAWWQESQWPMERLPTIILTPPEMRGFPCSAQQISPTQWSQYMTFTPPTAHWMWPKSRYGMGGGGGRRRGLLKFSSPPHRSLLMSIVYINAGKWA